MSAIASDNRAAHNATIHEVFHSAKIMRELANGYAFALPNETAIVMRVGEFIANERLCCPFFGFTLHVEPDGRDLWLHLTGPEGIKPFILAEIGSALNPSVVRP